MRRKYLALQFITGAILVARSVPNGALVPQTVNMETQEQQPEVECAVDSCAPGSPEVQVREGQGRLVPRPASLSSIQLPVA